MKVDGHFRRTDVVSRVTLPITYVSDYTTPLAKTLEHDEQVQHNTKSQVRMPT